MFEYTELRTTIYTGNKKYNTTTDTHVQNKHINLEKRDLYLRSQSSRQQENRTRRLS
jgi:hypothetical protein